MEGENMEAQDKQKIVNLMHQISKIQNCEQQVQENIGIITNDRTAY